MKLNRIMDAIPRQSCCQHLLAIDDSAIKTNIDANINKHVIIVLSLWRIIELRRMATGSRRRVQSVNIVKVAWPYTTPSVAAFEAHPLVIPLNMNSVIFE
jgi:hypothetical protein